MSSPEVPAQDPWCRSKRRWTAVGVLVLAAIVDAACTNTAHHGGAATRQTLGLSPGAPSSTTTAVGEEDDTGATGAPTIAGAVVAPGAGGSSGPAACRSGPPLANVYHPDRLLVVKPCLTVSGTVETIRSESDGDTHFDLAVDPPFTGLLRPANSSAQHGWLVAEIVPADEPGCTPGQPPRPATGSYDYGICTGADEAVPAVGQHVYVTGPYVVDNDHGGWAEIHPVWAVSTQAAAPATPQGPPAPATTQAAAPTPTSPTPSGVRIVSVTSPVGRGSTASLSAQAAPNASCNLAVTLPSGAPSRSQGLGPGTAASSGDVQWEWRTGTTTTPGTATATVTCGSGSATTQFQITA